MYLDKNEPQYIVFTDGNLEMALYPDKINVIKNKRNDRKEYLSWMTKIGWLSIRLPG
jgi:hypothetical protein